jgi:hypothetical protein
MSLVIGVHYGNYYSESYFGTIRQMTDDECWRDRLIKVRESLILVAM